MDLRPSPRARPVLGALAGSAALVGLTGCGTSFGFPQSTTWGPSLASDQATAAGDPQRLPLGRFVGVVSSIASDGVHLGGSSGAAPRVL